MYKKIRHRERGAEIIVTKNTVLIGFTIDAQREESK